MIVKKLLTALENKGDIKHFKKEILKEVIEYAKLKEKRGTSRPIYLTDYKGVILTKSHCINLCKLYLDEIFDEDEIDYIVSGLCLLGFSEELEFENKDELFDIIEELSDPSINGELTKERVEFILNNLKNFKSEQV